MKDIITYQLQNFNGSTVKDWGWMKNFIPPYFCLRSNTVLCHVADSFVRTTAQDTTYINQATEIVTTVKPWWRHQMETFSVLLVICAGNSLVPGEFSTQRPVTRSCDVFFDLRLNKRLSKQSWGWWFETLSRPLWRQCNAQSKRKSKLPACHHSKLVHHWFR